MASSGRVVVNPEDLRGGDGTIRRALELWSCRNGPIRYNEWQSLFFGLIREHGFEDDEAPSGESKAARGLRIRVMYNEIQEEFHGPDHLAASVVLEAARSEAGREMVPYNGPPVATGQDPSRAAAQDLPGRSAEQYAVFTPRQAEGAPEGRDSPDGLLHLEGAEAAWDEDGVTHTEATVEQDERLERLATALGKVKGAEPYGVEFVVRVEQLIPEYRTLYGVWVSEDPASRAGISLKEFAGEKLSELNPDLFVSEYELKRHVYALGKLSGRDAAQSQIYGKALWNTSSSTTPEAVKSLDVTPGKSGARPAQATPEKSPYGASSRGATAGVTPGPAISQHEVVNVVESVAKGFQGAMDNVMTKVAELQATRSSEEREDYTTDRFQSISSVDFKRKPPMIEDNDPDIERHDRAFDNMIACYSLGRTKLREIDKLHMYASGFKEGSTRRKVYDNIVRKATRKNRIPGEAKEVLAEIRKELRTYIWETSMQKMTRLDKEFEALEQGGLSHADFRALWESKLQDMEEAEMDMPTENTLFRKYLTKLHPEIRTRVLQKEWKLDGDDNPARAPKTYQDVAKAVGLLLEDKADIHAADQARTDALMVINPGGPAMPPHSSCERRR